MAFIRGIPKLQLEQMGFGELDVGQEQDFLSESSLSDQDFGVLMKENFFEIASELQEDQSSVKIPPYDVTKSYDSEFYNLFI